MENIWEGSNIGPTRNSLDGAASADAGGTKARSRYTHELLPGSTAKWAREIMRFWVRENENTLALAKVIAQARTSLRYGEWSELWRSEEMPFSKKKADMLVSIGRSMGGLDEQTFAQLPRGWSVLYCLSQLAQDVLRKLIDEEMVHPKLTLQQAKELLAKFNGRSSRNQSRGTGVQRRLRLFREYVERTLHNWTDEQRNWAETELGRLIDLIGTGVGNGSTLEDALPSGQDGQLTVPLISSDPPPVGAQHSRRTLASV